MMILQLSKKLFFFALRHFSTKKGLLLQTFFFTNKKKTWYEPHEGQIVNGMRGAFFSYVAFSTYASMHTRIYHI